MKKIGFIILLGVSAMMAKAQIQSDTLQYVVMRVNNAILDCPHFGGLFFKFCNENNWKTIENNHQKRYVIYGLPKNVEYNPVEKYTKYLEDIHFPKTMVQEIVNIQTKKEVDGYLNNPQKH